MRLLLDTHILLWWLQEPKKLSAASKRLITSGDCAVSVVSLWELAMNEERGRVRLPTTLDAEIDKQGFRIIPLKAEHIDAYRQTTASIPDPFDRMIVAVATVEQLTLATRDGHLLSLGLGNIREF